MKSILILNMAAQVLTGTGNVSYTNNTGQNVRIIVNVYQFSSAVTVSMSVGGSTFTAASVLGFGKNYAFSTSRSTASFFASNILSTAEAGLPIEVMLSAGQSFSVSSAAASSNYNILVIPEAG
jgi:hypothetical protein